MLVPFITDVLLADGGPFTLPALNSVFPHAAPAHVWLGSVYRDYLRWCCLAVAFEKVAVEAGWLL